MCELDVVVTQAQGESELENPAVAVVIEVQKGVYRALRGTEVLTCRLRGRLAREELLSSLIPLYFGKTLSYVRKTARMSVQQAEEFIENECMVFEESKPYLVDRWGS